MSVEEIVQVNVNPCIVDTYEASLKVIEILYNVGLPEKNDGNYEFAQSPNCKYPQSVTVSNLPSWATHNEAAQDFSISSIADLSMIGQYTVDMHSEIQIPDDATQATFTTMTVDY